MGGVSLIILLIVIILAVIAAVIFFVGHGALQGMRPGASRAGDGERPPHTEVEGEHFGPHPEAEPRTAVSRSEDS